VNSCDISANNCWSLAVGKLPPMVGVFVDSLGHVCNQELPSYPPCVECLAIELLP